MSLLSLSVYFTHILPHLPRKPKLSVCARRRVPRGDFVSRDAPTERRAGTPLGMIAAWLGVLLAHVNPAREPDVTVDLTTGVGVWDGAPPAATVQGWLAPSKGHWIGLHAEVLVVRTSFEITEPACASFELDVAAADRVTSAEVNGHPLPVPSAQGPASLSRLSVARGKGFFKRGINTLVLNVAKFAGIAAVYVQGTLQLLCPMSDAMAFMDPTLGPVSGDTLVEVRSNVGVYSGSRITCVFGSTPSLATAVGVSSIRCRSPAVSSRSWRDVEVQLGPRPSAAGTPYQENRLVGTFYFYGDPVISSVAPRLGPTSGGTRVLVCGRIEYIPTTRCAFGLQADAVAVVPRALASNRIECSTPSKATGSRVGIRLTINGQQYGGAPSLFLYHDEIDVITLSLTKLSSEGGTTVSVLARNRLPDDLSAWAAKSAVCRIGASIVRASISGATTVSCTAPAGTCGFVPVELSWNGRDFSASGMQAEYVATVLERIDPTNGPAWGGTTITIYGRNFVEATWECYVGISRGLLSVVSENVMMCTSPAAAGIGWAAVSIFQGTGQIGNRASFFIGSVLAKGVAPPLGPERGGTRVAVAIEGAELRDASTVRCRMGNGSGAVLARRVDGAQLECASAARGLGAARVSLSVNARQYGAAAGAAGGAARFTYQPASAASWLVPARALAEGGTAVTAHGSGFSALSDALGLLACKIMRVFVRAVRLHRAAVACPLPAFAPTVAFLDVSNNGLQQTDQQSPVLLELVSVHTLDVTPWHGPIDGSTKVIVRLDAAISLPAFCQFGDRSPVPASAHAPRQLACHSPPSARTGWTSLDIGIMTGMITPPSSFYYEPPFYLLPSGPGKPAFAPALGPERGGTVVTVYGAGFLLTAKPQCRFGPTSVTSRFLSANSVECISPSHSPGAVPLEISVNGQQFSDNGELFLYHRAIKLAAISPQQGPSDSSLAVTLTGTGFVSQPLLTCRFGYVHSPATYLDPTRVKCQVPHHPPGYTPVDVANNMVDFSLQARMFFFQHVMVESVYPVVVSQLGGETLYITGTGFPPPDEDPLWCIFGDMNPVLAHWESSTSLVCQTPANRLIGQTALSVMSSYITYPGRPVVTFRQRPRLLSVQPSQGPTRGGTKVVLRGSYFGGSTSDRCFFGSMMTIPKVVSQGVFECFSPPAFTPATVRLTVNHEASLGMAEFAYHEELSVTVLKPNQGPARGGTSTEVSGKV